MYGMYRMYVCYLHTTVYTKYCTKSIKKKYINGNTKMGKVKFYDRYLKITDFVRNFQAPKF